jgi:uncharacterized OB-fold protein
MTSSVDADQLLTSVDGTRRLLGGRCPACETHAFPIQGACPKCGTALVEVALPDAGTLWSVTVQRLAPKPPFAGAGSSAFEPFAVGYVDLGPLLVETPLFGRAPEAWQIGDQVQLVAGDSSRPGWRFWFEAAARS